MDDDAIVQAKLGCECIGVSGKADKGSTTQFLQLPGELLALRMSQVGDDLLDMSECALEQRREVVVTHNAGAHRERSQRFVHLGNFWVPYRFPYTVHAAIRQVVQRLCEGLLRGCPARRRTSAAVRCSGYLSLGTPYTRSTSGITLEGGA